MPRLLAALGAAASLLAASPAHAQQLSDPRVATNAAGTTAAWVRAGGETWELQVADAAGDGAFGAPATLVRSTSPLRLAGVTRSEGGDVLVVWQRFESSRPVGGGPPRGWVEAAVRRAGDAFGPVMAVSDGPVDPHWGAGVTVAMGRGGHAVVAWMQGGAARAAALEPGDPFVPIAAPEGLGAPLEVSVGDDGEAVLGGTACTGHDCAFAIARRNANRGFGPLRRLNPAPSFSDRQAVAIGPRAEVLAVTARHQHPPAVLAFRPEPVPEQTPEEPLSDRDAIAVDAAVAADGESVAAWSRTVPAGGGVDVAFAPRGQAFGAPQQLDGAHVGDVRLGVGVAGDAAVGWVTGGREVRLARRRRGEPFGPAGVVRAGGGSTGRLELSHGWERTALVWMEEDGRAVRVVAATAGPQGAAPAVQVLAEAPNGFPPLPVAAARIPRHVRALARRGGAVRVPVACEVICRGTVVVRAGGRTRRARFALDDAAGTYVRVPVARRARRAEVRVLTGERRTDRRVLALRRTAAPVCPRVAWARVLDRRGGTVVTSEGPFTRQRVVACRLAGPRARVLTTVGEGELMSSTTVVQARAGARSVALVTRFGSRDSGGSETLQLHDVRTGRALAGDLVGSSEPYVPDPPVYGVFGLRLTTRGDAAAIIRNGHSVEVRALMRSGERRVLDAGPGVEPGTLGVSGTRVTWRTGGEERSATL